MNEDITVILDKVNTLYRKYGIKSVTMDDISRELGISKKTLYQYFTDKNDLVNKSIDYEISKRLQQFQSVFKKNLNAIEELLEVNKLAHLMMKEYSPATEYDLKKYYPWIHEKISQIKCKNMYEMVLLNMKKGKAEGIFRSDLNEEIIAKLHVSRIISMAENSLFSYDEFFSQQVFKEVFNYHLRGIINDRGLAILENIVKEQRLYEEKN